MLSVNILAQFVRDRAALLRWLQDLKPDAVLVMDDYALAVEIKRLLPTATVIYRHWHEHDAEWHHKVSASDWLTAHAQFGQNGIVVQALNEPGGYGDVTPLVNWCVDLMRLAHARGIPLALPSFAVGHPDEKLIASGAFDRLLKAFDQYHEHLLLDHEYFVNHADDEPWNVGRVYLLHQRAKQLKLTPPRVVIGECGRDVGGGERDGWKHTGWSEAEYFARIREQAARYKVLFDQPIPMMLFCYGRGGNGRWDSFDIEQADTLKTLMVQENRKEAMTQTPTNAYGKRIPRGRVTLRNMGSAKNVRVRNAPTTSGSEIVGSLFGGEELPYYETVVNGWRKVEFDGAPAFVSDEFTVFEEVVDQFPPVTIPLPELDLDENERENCAKALEWLAGLVRTGVTQTS